MILDEFLLQRAAILRSQAKVLVVVGVLSAFELFQLVPPQYSSSDSRPNGRLPSRPPALAFICNSPEINTATGMFSWPSLGPEISSRQPAPAGNPIGPAGRKYQNSYRQYGRRKRASQRTLEPLKKCCGHLERGFLSPGEASATEEVRRDLRRSRNDARTPRPLSLEGPKWL